MLKLLYYSGYKLKAGCAPPPHRGGKKISLGYNASRELLPVNDDKSVAINQFFIPIKEIFQLLCVLFN